MAKQKKGGNAPVKKTKKPQRRSYDAIEKLHSLGCDPLAEMWGLYALAKQNDDFVLAGRLIIELAQYVAAKKKSVEQKVEVADPITINFEVAPKTPDQIDSERIEDQEAKLIESTGGVEPTEGIAEDMEPVEVTISRIGKVG